MFSRYLKRVSASLAEGPVSVLRVVLSVLERAYFAPASNLAKLNTVPS